MKFNQVVFIQFLAVVFLLPFQFAQGSTSERPQFAPAQDPHFELLESTEQHARVRYTRLDKSSFNRQEARLYLAIPIGATYTVKPISWEMAIYDDQEPVQRFAATSPQDLESVDQQAEFDIQNALNSAITTEVFHFFQLDGLRIEIDAILNSRSRAGRGYSREKPVLESLGFEVAWQPGQPARPATLSDKDAGMTRLYRNLFINAAQAERIRGKRSLPEDETTKGFAPEILGYDFQAPPVNAADGSLPPRQDGVRVRVRHEGITAIRPEDIRKQGMEPGVIQLDEARLWHRGQEQALFIDDDGDGVLTDDEAIYFYSPKTDSEYTNDRIYTLTWSKFNSAPKRVEQKPLQTADSQTERFPVRKVIDEDNVLAQIKANHYGWFLRSLTERRTLFGVDLPGAATGEVRVGVKMLNKTRQNTKVLVNFARNRREAMVSINNVTTVTMQFTAEALTQHENLLLGLYEKPSDAPTRSFSARVGHDPFIHIDTIEVVYPRSATEVLNAITVEKELLPENLSTLPLKINRRSPAFRAWLVKDGQLQGVRNAPPGESFNGMALPEGKWQQLVLQANERVASPYTIDFEPHTTLHHTNQGYDYVIIAHRLFMDEARRLVQHRRQDGFQVLLVDVQDIYDEFNYSYPHSEAIKRFLRYAQAEWRGPAPEFVTLIGDSSWDHRDREDQGAVDQVPTYAPVENPQHDGSDAWYAYLWGGEDDDFSDLIIGRISVRAKDELAAYLDKLILYETEMPVGPWKMRNVFITDDTFENYSKKSAEESLPAQLMPKHINQIEFPHVTNPYLYHRFAGTDDASMSQYTNAKYCPDCTLAIIDSFDEGALLMQYIGHGGNQIWSHERIFYGTDRPYSNLLELQPNNRFPFSLHWSCLTGYLNYNVPPFNVCMAEEMLRYRDKGAIAVWAPSGSTSTDQHMLMAHLLNRSMFENGMTRVGEGVIFTKNEYMQIQHHPNLIKQYVLFGDPATRLATPPETLSAHVTPPIMHPNQTAEYTVQAQVDGFDSGQAIAALAVDGNTVYRSKPFAFENGTINHVIATEHEAIEYATGKISIYAWNEKENLDAWGGAELSKHEPKIQLSEGRASTHNGQTKIEFSVANLSRFDVAGLEVTLDLVQRVESLVVDSVPAHATTTARWMGQTPQGLETVYAALKDESLLPDDVRQSDKGLSIALPRAESKPVIPLLGRRDFSSNEPTAGSVSRLQIPLLNQDKINQATAMVALEGPGSATEANAVSLPSGRERTVDFRLTFPEMGEYTYRLHVESAGQRQTYAFPVSVQGKPDLALAEGDFTFEPEMPVVGKTVRIRTTVYNVGAGTARNISVQSYDGDPSLNRVLRPFNHRRTDKIAVLKPGGMKEVEIVWDPESYEGQGLHNIHIVVDPHERIEESSEANNRIHFPLTLHQLPDLKVDPWVDHEMTTKFENDLAQWGQPLTLEARVRNMGETPADYVRVSFMHNYEEMTRFIDRITPRGGVETAVTVPLHSAKNVYHVHVDKYDLIGEDGETAEGAGNNRSQEKRMYVDLMMPDTPIVNGARVYEVQRETQFSAGHAEYLMYDEHHEQLTLHPEIEDTQVPVHPVYVTNPDKYERRIRPDKWLWNVKHNVFTTPAEKSVSLRLRFPAPKGTFDVYARMHSPADDIEGATGEIQYKTPADRDFINLTLNPDDSDALYYKLGRYTLRDDEFLLELRSLPIEHVVAVKNLKFVRANLNQPVGAGYLSALFPAWGRSGKPLEMQWEADVPEETALRVKGRWVSYKEDKSLRFTPWMRVTPGENGRLQMPGQGDFFQFYLDFSRETRESDASPSVRSIQIKIPSHEMSG